MRLGDVLCLGTFDLYTPEGALIAPICKKPLGEIEVWKCLAKLTSRLAEDHVQEKMG